MNLVCKCNVYQITVLVYYNFLNVGPGHFSRVGPYFAGGVGIF
jgi:hypothetical protein